MEDLWSYLKSLNDKEKGLLASYEQRSSGLNQHRKLILRLSRSLEEGDRDEILSAIDELHTLLRNSFYSLDFTEDLAKIPAEEKRVLEDDIREEKKAFQVIGSNGSAAEKKGRRYLKKLLSAEEDEGRLLDHLQERIERFHLILEREREKVLLEYKLLSQISNMIRQNSFRTEMSKHISKKRQEHQKTIDKLLRLEKKLVHWPIDALLQKTTHIDSVKRRLEQKNAITLQEMKDDVYKLVDSAEVTRYQNLFRMKSPFRDLLDQKTKRFIDYLDKYKENMEVSERHDRMILNTLANYDRLTSLPNRNMAVASVIPLLNSCFRSEQEDKEQNISVLFMDIDHFKTFNDTYGHEVGDRVLREVARIIKKGRRKNDFEARWGGEEFLVVLPGASKAHARDVAENIRKSVMEGSVDLMDRINHNFIRNRFPQVFGSKMYKSTRQKVEHVQKVLKVPVRKSITVTIGVASYPQDMKFKDVFSRYKITNRNIEDFFNRLLKIADERLYKGKKKLGRNRVVSK